MVSAINLNPAHATPGFIGRIPVRNIWLLLLYASQLYRELPEARRVELEDAPDDIPELVAKILANAVARRLRRNLNSDYRRRVDDLNRVRGRINLLRTERRQLLQRARVACIYDELTVDTPRNRYVKAALLRLASVVRRPELASRCRNLAARLERAGVQTELDLKRLRRDATLDNLGWTDADERQMLAAARLAFDLAIPTEAVGRSLLVTPKRDANPGWRLYEAAVAGFYGATLSHRGWRVRAQSGIVWPLENPTPGLLPIMPRMFRDVVLERGNRRIVIDTKFTSIVAGGPYRERSLRPANIYQIYAYLRSQENAADPLSLNSAGVLLYPSLGVDYDEAATIQGHEIRFVTVDLSADSPTIRRQLLQAVDATPAPGREGGSAGEVCGSVPI